MKDNKKHMSIKNIVIILFIIFMLTIVSLTSYLIYSNWMLTTNENIIRIAENMHNHIYHEVDMLFGFQQKTNNISKDLLERNILDIDNETVLEKFIVSTISSQSKHIHSFAYAKKNGDFYGVRRNKYNEFQITKVNEETKGNLWHFSVTEDLTSGELLGINSEFDPRDREWFKRAKKSKEITFSPVYSDYITGEVMITAATSVVNKDGEFEGVILLDIALSSLSEFLDEIVESDGATALIIEKDSGELIASSFGMKVFEVLGEDKFKRALIHDIDNPFIVDAYDKYKDSGRNNLQVRDKLDRLYINLSEFKFEGLNWLVITCIPRSVLAQDLINSMILSVFIIILATVILILIHYKFINVFLNPIKNILTTTEKIAKGDLSQRANVIRNDEIGKIALSVNKMADTIFMLINNLECKVKERTLELEESKNNLHLILNSTAEGIYGMDIEGRFTFCNASFLEILGYKDEKELIGKVVHELIHHSYKDGTPIPIDECNVINAMKEGRGITVNDEVYWKADGTCIDVSYSSSPQYKDGKLIGVVVSFNDITDRKENEERIKYLTYHDSLTGLYNKLFFEEEINRIDTESNLPISIILGDVNGLKLVNDIFGHSKGDELLQKVASVLKKVCRKDDIIVRLGGDEFLIMLPKTSENEVSKVMNRIKVNMAKESLLAIRGSISIGSATKTNMNQDITTLIEEADEKMYKEKTLNKQNQSVDQLKHIINYLHEISPREKLHSENVSAISMKIGMEMNLSNKDINILKYAGYLHDIGKVAIDKELVREISDLTEDERKEMRRHPIVGYRILNLFDNTIDLAEIVLAHHEYYDGTGYPKGMKGNEIPLLSRIITVAENYEAMTNKYNKNRIRKEEAIAIIKKQSGFKYDSKVVEAFINVMQEDKKYER